MKLQSHGWCSNYSSLTLCLKKPKKANVEKSLNNQARTMVIGFLGKEKNRPQPSWIVLPIAGAHAPRALK